MIALATEKDLKKIYNYVQRKPSENIFILGDLDDHGLEHDFQQIYLEWKKQEINCIYLRFYDSLVIYSESDDFDVLAGIDLIKRLNPTVVNGLKRITDRFYPSLKNKYEEINTYFCRLTQGDFLEKTTNACAHATFDNVHEIVEGYIQTEEFARSGTTFEDQLKKMTKKFEVNKTIEAVVQVNGKIVAHANTGCESKSSGMITGVYTLEGYRNKGYASQLVSFVCQDLLSRNKEACLFYDNPKAGSIYHRLGFVTFDQWVMLNRK